MKHDETHTRYIKWEPVAGYGLRRTVSSDDLPRGVYLYSYQWGPWWLALDPDEVVQTLSIDQLNEIVQKLKALNEGDTHNGRDTYRERSEEQVPGF